MTMRLDIVTNDAGEGVRREHARELGAGVVIAIYRLAKLAQLHDLANQAFTRQLEQTHQIIGDYCLRSGSNVNVLFAHKAVFVAGQLLKGSRHTYEAASELGELFERLGGSELYIQRDLTREELLAFSEQISNSYRGQRFRAPTSKIRLRPVADNARLRGLELESLSEDQRIVRMYASAVVIMRRFYEDLQASRYILPRRIKRIAQSLVDLSDGSTPSFLGVTEVRNANFDEAGRAVNTAILAVSMAREVTQDRALLSQIAMAAMMHDVARPRAMALSQAAGPAMAGMQGPSTLSEDQEDRLAAGAAAVLTALGRVNEPSITRTVLAFEALWIRRQTWLGPVYWGARAPTLHAKLIAVARRYNDLLTPEPGIEPQPPDYAVAALSEELKDPQDRTVLRMLVSALGLLPMGTVVQLSTGEVAEVVRGPRGPGEKPRVRVVMDANGQQIQPVEIELTQDPHRLVARVMSVDGWRKGLELRPGVEAEAYGDERESPPQAAPLSPISPLAPIVMPPPGGTAHAQATARSIAAQYAEKYATWSEDDKPKGARRGEGIEGSSPPRRESSSIQSAEHNSSASLPSMGSSPSAVAEAMGRMINDSLRPPATGLRDVDRTLFHDPGAAGSTASNRPERPAREPTARGSLAATPLPHVLVYMLDHSLTGSVVFEGSAGEDALYFVGGVPTKARLQDQVALLGQVLVHGGAIETNAVEQAVEGARRLGVLLGEYLVGHDLVSREALSWALEAQLLNKIAYLANLAPEISYAYYRDVDLLEGWGGGDVSVGCALNPILASVRNWMDRARVRATLNRIGKHPLVLDEATALSNLALLPEEQATLDVIRATALPLAQLFKRNVADEEVVSSLVYSLAVTRQFAFKGQKKGPMAGTAGSQWKSAGPTSGPPASPSSIPVELPGSGSGSVPVSALIATSNVPSPRQAQAAVGASPPRTGVTPAASPPQSRASVPAAASAAPSTRLPAASQSGTPAASPRKAGPAPQPPAAGPLSRAMQPAVRPPMQGAARASVPQIRPMTARKSTMVGIQPAHTAEQRPESGRPPAPSAAPSGTTVPSPPIAAATPSLRRAEATPSDGMRTIALPAPGFGPSSGQPGPGSPLGTRPPSASSSGLSRAAPGLPTKLTLPRASAAPVSGSRGEPSQASASLKPAQKSLLPGAERSGLARTSPRPPAVQAGKTASVAGDEGADLESTDERDIGLELGAERATAQGNAIEIGDAGLADAEVALEAMQSFRAAESALQRNDLANAERLAQRALEGDPTQADYLTLLAWVRSLDNSAAGVGEAITTMSNVLRDDPSNERALLYRGKLLARSNRLQEARADFDEVLAGNPQNREAQAELRALDTKMP